MMEYTEYLWDPLEDNIIAEYDGGGLAVTEYTTEPSLYGNIVSQNRIDSGTSFYHADGQGSTLALTDRDANATDTYSYTAFGESTEQSGTTKAPFRYIGAKGYAWDRDSESYYIRARLYQASQARWQSADSLSELARYLYSNNPANDVDPSGLAVIKATRQLLSPSAECGKDRKGEACVRYKWDVDADTKKKWPCGRGRGYLVQRVQYYCEVSACETCTETVPESPILTFFEAAMVTKTRTTHADIAAGYCFTGSCGVVRHSGELKFFCESQTGNLERTWKGIQTFGKNPCTITGGPLTFLATEEGPAPEWWDEPETGDTVAKRTFDLTWECCGCSKFKCSATSDPTTEVKVTKKPGEGLSACN